MNIIKKGAIFGLISFIFLIVYTIILSYQTAVYYLSQTPYSYSNFQIILLNIILLAGSVGILYFYSAFLKLAEKYKNKLLKITSWVFLIFGIINVVMNIISFTLTSIELVRAEDAVSSIDPFLAIFVLIILLLFVIVSGALSILFGVSILRLGKEVKYSRVTGILYLVSGATMVILIGFLFVWVANFFSVALLWKESEKTSKKGKKK
jgi:uncharacterized membrane protein